MMKNPYGKVDISAYGFIFQLCILATNLILHYIETVLVHYIEIVLQRETCPFPLPEVVDEYLVH